mgnify:CR=1 FL=1
MAFPPDFSSTRTYANRYDLDKIDVFLDGDGNNPMFFSVSGLPDKLSYGKHYFEISLLDTSNQQYRLTPESELLFEFKSINDVVLKSDIIGFNLKNGIALCFVEVLGDPLRSMKPITDGEGTLIIAGKLQEKSNTTNRIPQKFKGAVNYRCTFPLIIAKDLPNQSPILFKSIENIQASSSFSESLDLDLGESVYKRSYMNISASHLETYGGRVDRLELSLREIRTVDNEYRVLTTYPLSGSAYEVSNEFTGGLNPESSFQKVPIPRDIRRNGSVEFRLRFLNSKGEYAQDIKNPNISVAITGSLIITGSPLILETADNLVTGSGALSFGTSLDDAVKMIPDFKNESIKFEHVKSGVVQKTLLTIEGANDGKIIYDPDKNSIAGNVTTGSLILAAENSNISSSKLSCIIGGDDNVISQSYNSAIIGGEQNTISQKFSDSSDIDYGLANVIIGANVSSITGNRNDASQCKMNSIVGGFSNEITAATASYNDPQYNAIVGGLLNHISMSDSSVIIGGRLNNIQSPDESVIIGGTGNIIAPGAHRTVVIGGQSINATESDTVYVQNIDVRGTMTVQQLHTSTLSSSILYQSGSTKFGDTADDIHTFTGSYIAMSSSRGDLLQVQGDISASGDLFAGDPNGSYMHYDHSAKQLIIDSVYGTSNEDYFTIKKGTSNTIFNVDEDGDVSFDGGMVAGGSVKGNGYFYGPDNDSSIDIQSTGIRLRVNDGTNTIAWFDDDQISLGPGSQDVDVKIGASGLGGFFDYATTNFGVGNITPTEKLVVTGNISASGDLHIQGDITASGAINTLSHITASGNISSSGTITAAAIVGTTIDASTDFTIGGTVITDNTITDDGTLIIASTTATSFSDGNITNVGTIDVDTIRADAATDVQIVLGTPGITFAGEAGDLFEFNGEEDVGFTIKNANGHQFYVDGNDAKVGIGQGGYGADNIPPKTLTVEGDISASGDLHLGQPPHNIGKFNVQHGSPTGSGATSFTTCGEGYGDIVQIAAVTTKPGLIYRFQGNNNWVAVSNSSELAGTDLLGIAMGTNSGTDGMLLRGFAHISQSGTIGMANRAFIPSSSAATPAGVATGSFTNFASGEFIRCIGHMLTDGNADGSASIYFNPDLTYIEKA